MKYSIRGAVAGEEQDLKDVLVRNGQKPTIVICDESVYFVAVAGERPVETIEVGEESPVKVVEEERPVESLAVEEERPVKVVEGEVAGGGAGEFLGLIGAEISGQTALIRSLAVLAPYRGNGIAGKLVETLLQELHERGITRLYLFSRDTGGYWRRLGFAGCDVREVAGELPDAPQVAGYMSDGSIWTDVAWCRDLSPFILSPG